MASTSGHKRNGSSSSMFTHKRTESGGGFIGHKRSESGHKRAESISSAFGYKRSESGHKRNESSGGGFGHKRWFSPFRTLPYLPSLLLTFVQVESLSSFLSSLLFSPFFFLSFLNTLSFPSSCESNVIYRGPCLSLKERSGKTAFQGLRVWILTLVIRLLGFTFMGQLFETINVVLFLNRDSEPV